MLSSVFLKAMVLFNSKTVLTHEENGKLLLNLNFHSMLFIIFEALVVPVIGKHLIIFEYHT